MKWNHPQITLVPRSVGNCIDFAIRFFSQYFSLFIKLWLLITVPSCLLMYFLSYKFELGGWTAFLIFFLASAPLGTLVTLATTPVLRGDHCSTQGLHWQIAETGPLIFVKTFILRVTIGLGLLLLLFPGIWIALAYRFTVEKESLENMDIPLHDENADQLIKEQTGNALGHAILITSFCLILFGVLFISFDITLEYVFQYPIFTSRFLELLFNSPEYENGTALGYLLWYDPRVLMLAIGTALFVYPIGRLALFFTYVDCRVRHDCWDVELSFNDIVRKLERER